MNIDGDSEEEDAHIQKDRWYLCVLFWAKVIACGVRADYHPTNFRKRAYNDLEISSHLDLLARSPRLGQMTLMNFWAH